MGLIRSVPTLLLTLALARPALAQESGAVFAEGKALAEAGDYAKACPKFEASLELDPLLGTRLNLADCFAKIGKYASAKRQFEKAAKEARDRADDRIAFIEEQLAQIGPKVARLTVSVVQGPEQLAVRVAGQPLSSARFGMAEERDAGPVTVEVLRDDEVLDSRSVTLSDGQAEALELDLAAIAKAHPLKPKVTLVPPDPTQRNVGIAVLSVGLAGVAAFGVLEGVALAVKGEASSPENCFVPEEGATVCSPEGYRLSQQAGDLAEVGQWVGVGGLAVAAVGLTVFLTAPTEPVPVEAAYVVPWFGPGSGGLVAGGRF
jgi:hypothetical protein